MRSNLDLLLRHDERAIEQREIANPTLPIVADGNGAACVARNVFADNHGARLLAAKPAEDLRGLAIKSRPELNVCGDRLRPPIAFDVPVLSDVAHEGKCPAL